VGNKRISLRENLETLEFFVGHDVDRDKELLLHWLNTKGGGRIFTVVCGMNLATDLIQECKEAKSETIATQLAEALSTWMQLFYPVLDKYNYRIGLVPHGGRRPWLIILTASGKYAKSCIQLGSSKVYEGDAVMSALWLAQAGTLHRVRVCKECGKWFFARRVVDLTCGKQCHDTHIRCSDDYRQRRKLYMRIHRLKLKQREALELALARTARHPRHEAD
jgi:hypothetical protein